MVGSGRLDAAHTSDHPFTKMSAIERATNWRVSPPISWACDTSNKEEARYLLKVSSYDRRPCGVQE